MGLRCCSRRCAASLLRLFSSSWRCGIASRVCYCVGPPLCALGPLLSPLPGASREPVLCVSVYAAPLPAASDSVCVKACGAVELSLFRPLPLRAFVSCLALAWPPNWYSNHNNNKHRPHQGICGRPSLRSSHHS
jgi:hypothetical protein